MFHFAGSQLQMFSQLPCTAEQQSVMCCGAECSVDEQPVLCLSSGWCVQQRASPSLLHSELLSSICGCAGAIKQIGYDADQVTEASHVMHLQHHHPIVASYTETMLQPASQQVVTEPDMLQHQAERDQAALHLIFSKSTAGP